MRITQIEVSNLKGRFELIDVVSRCLLLTGPMGSGKSSVIDGLHLALNLPTRFGSTQLERLSPNGTWRVGVAFDDDQIKSIEREQKGSRAGFMVNGMVVDKSEYLTAVNSLLEVEPHHVSIGAILELSGQKRAALFSEMLQDGELMDVAKLLGEDKPLGDLDPGVLADAIVSRHLARLAVMKGTPADLVNGVRDVHNALTQANRDAKTRYAGLLNQQASLTHGQSTGELKDAIQAIDQKIGAINSALQEIQADKERYDSANAVVDRVKRKIQEMKGQEQGLRAQIAYADRDSKSLIDAIDAEKAGDEGLKAAQKILSDKRGAVDEARRSLDQAQSEQRILSELCDREWNVPADWLRAQTEEFLVQINATVTSIDEATTKAAMDFAREVTIETFGGTKEKIAERIKTLTAAKETADTGYREAHAALLAAERALLTAQGRVSTFRRAVQSTMNAEEMLSTLLEAMAAEEAGRIELEAAAARVAVKADDQSLRSELTAQTAERGRLAGRLQELESAKAISGQVDQANFDIAASGTALECVAGLLVRAQRVRDKKATDRLSDAWAPFVERFKMFFPDDVSLSHRVVGDGRSTEFTFIVDRGSMHVPIEMLSDGEAVLASAAFLGALQGVKKGPGSFLSFNSEALDASGLDRLLAGLPRLGLDFAVVANNRAGSDPVEHWQTHRCNLGK